MVTRIVLPLDATPSPSDVVRRVASLTEREYQVMVSVLAAETNREAAESLGISHRTVEVHRLSVMHTIGARNTAHLVRLLTLAGY